MNIFSLGDLVHLKESRDIPFTTFSPGHSSTEMISLTPADKLLVRDVGRLDQFFVRVAYNHPGLASFGTNPGDLPLDWLTK